MSGWRQRLLATLGAAAVLLAGCGGSSAKLAPTATPGESPTAATAPAKAPPRVLATATPDVQEPAPPCRVDDLSVAARGPVGATAMLSLTLGIANVGGEPCTLAPPSSARLVDARDGHLLAASPPGHLALPAITVRPTRALGEEDYTAPPGSAYVWLLWNWRIDTACVVYDPPSVTVVIAFPEFELQSDAPVKFGPCEGQIAIMGFARIPPRD